MAPEYLRTKILDPDTLVGSSYKILRVLKESPDSVVYEATQLLLLRNVVVKVLNFGGEEIDSRRMLRFQQEAKSASSLDHPNIVKTLGAGTLEDGRPYIVMELVDGSTLRDHLEKSGSLRLDAFKDVFLQLLSGMEYVHNMGLLHRDIKPENILLSQASDGLYTAKLTDFGIAKVMDESHGEQSLTATREVVGSPAYMSPEQCQFLKLDQRSDIYSLGCVMYESIAGQPPFTAESSLDLMYKQLHEHPVRLDKLDGRIPSSTAAVIDRCLHKSARDRWANAAELKQALLPTPSNYVSLKRKTAIVLIIAAVVSGFVIVFLCRGLVKYKQDQFIRSAVHPKHVDAKAAAASFDEFHAAMAAGNYKSAMNVLNNLRLQAELPDQARLHACYSYYYLTLEDYPECLKYAQLAAALAKKQKYNHDPLNYEHERIKQAMCYIKMREFDKTRPIIEEMEQRFENSGKVSDYLHICEVKCDFLNARKDCKGALAVSKKILDEEGLNAMQRFPFLLSRLLSYTLQNREKDYGVALREALNEIKALPQCADYSHAGAASFLNKVAEASLLKGDWKSAKRILIDAARYFNFSDECVNSTNRLRFMQHQALVDTGLSHLPSAQEKFDIARSVMENVGMKQCLSAYLGLAYIAHKNSNSVEAKRLIEKALSLPKEEWASCDPSNQSVELEQYLVRALIKEGNFAAAGRLLEQANSLPIQSPAQVRTSTELGRLLSGADHH